MIDSSKRGTKAKGKKEQRQEGDRKKCRVSVTACVPLSTVAVAAAAAVQGSHRTWIPFSHETRSKKFRRRILSLFSQCVSLPLYKTSVPWSPFSLPDFIPNHESLGKGKCSCTSRSSHRSCGGCSCAACLCRECVRRSMKQALARVSSPTSSRLQIRLKPRQ